MKKIVFYARICYLDSALEYIKSISNDYEIHLLIGISPNEKHENVMDINADINGHNTLTTFRSISKKWDIENLNKYFENLSSTNFVIYENDKSFYEIIKNGIKIIRFLYKIKPMYIHFDDFSFRQSVLIPYLLFNRKKIIMNIHDPKPHSGESIGYINILKKVIFKIVPKFVTYSDFSKSLLESFIPKRAEIISLKLLPYKSYQTKESSSDMNSITKSISFIGRLSAYKGLDIFAEAIRLVHVKFPNQKFIIAGKPVYGFDIKPLLDLPHTIIKSHFISKTELEDILMESNLVVCPYKDATQSGVVMTSYGFNVPVIVSNVGGLPEYVQDYKTGLILKEYSATELAKLIIEYIERNMYPEFQKYLHNNLLKDCYVKENYSKIKNKLYI